MAKDQTSLTTTEGTAQALLAAERRSLADKTVALLDTYAEHGIKKVEEEIKSLLDEKSFLEKMEARYRPKVAGA